MCGQAFVSPQIDLLRICLGAWRPARGITPGVLSASAKSYHA